MHLVGFVIRIYHNARPHECQTQQKYFACTDFLNWQKSNVDAVTY